MTRIKICGVRQVEHALAAARAGADFIGVICWPGSRRYAPPERVAEITAALRAACDYQNRPLVVGVFVNAPVADIGALVHDCGLDLVQLSGDEPWAEAAAMPVPAIKALRVPAGRSATDLAAELAHELPPHQARGGRLLLESRVAGQYGGTGRRMDWALAATTARRFPFLLSGGLNPQNVADAVRTVRPWGVDVASGVEGEDGRQQTDKIHAFIAAVRQADAELAAIPAAAR